MVLCLLIKFQPKITNCDNPTTSKIIKLKYGGIDIQLCCGNNTIFYLPYIEQNYYKYAFLMSKGINKSCKYV